MALSVVLGIAGVAMLLPEKESAKAVNLRLGCWNIVEGGNRYVVNLWLAAPLTLATGFFSGIVNALSVK